MLYCALTDIQERIPEDLLIQLTDDAGEGEVDTDQTDAAIGRADTEIDAMCGKRYVVPFATVPDIIRELSADLATLHLYGRRGADVPEAVANQAKAARDMLKTISKGDITIPGATSAANNNGPARIEVSSNQRIFTRDKLKGM